MDAAEDYEEALKAALEAVAAWRERALRAENLVLHLQDTVSELYRYQ